MRSGCARARRQRNLTDVPVICRVAACALLAVSASAQPQVYRLVLSKEDLLPRSARG